MIKGRKLLRLFVILLAALGCARLAQANLLTNGDFELPQAPNGSFIQYAGGSTAIPGWTVLGNNVILYSDSNPDVTYGIVAFNPESGLQSLDLTGSGNSGPTDGITQSVATVIGAPYVISFWVGAALSNNGSPEYQLPGAVDDLSINGGTEIPFSCVPTSSGFDTWTGYSYQFTATSAITSISFYNGTTSAIGDAGLDNVTLTEVPEPTSVVLLGLGGVTFFARRRQR
jgi:uncharacterized protein DUF642/PEP-CTERM motif-containing protein